MAQIFSATFEPFTYDQLSAPLREMTEAHQAQEQQFDELITDADKMKAFLNQDWQSYKDYSEYINKLNLAAEDLARNGLSRQNRGNLIGLKRDYNGKIQAINAGILKRENEIDQFNKSAKGQSSRYIGPRPEDYSVDEYMYGNNPFNVGVEGSEIYSFSKEQAEKSTSRRYDEFTEGGKWRISEVGVDQFTTQKVLEALDGGMDMLQLAQLDPQVAVLYNKNRRQFDYMQSVLDDMYDILNNTRDIYGYNSFYDIDENGNEVESRNQERFNSEILSGINAGIQYTRESQADPYSKMYAEYELRKKEKEADRQWDLYKLYLENGIKNGNITFDNNGNPVYTNTNHKNYPDIPGWIPQKRDRVNKDLKDALEKAGISNYGNILKQQPLLIEYNGKKFEFHDQVEAHQWAWQGYPGSVINTIERSLVYNNMSIINSARKILEDIGVVEQSENNITARDLQRRINEIQEEHERRMKILKDNDYYISDEDFAELKKQLEIPQTQTITYDNIIDRMQQSQKFNTLATYSRIPMCSVSGATIDDKGKVKYNTDDFLEKEKTLALQKINELDTRKINAYEVDENDFLYFADNVKKEQVKKIIENAISSYTTLEAIVKTDENDNVTPVMIFEDADGNKIGVPMNLIIPYSDTLSNYIKTSLFDENMDEINKGTFTGPARGEIETDLMYVIYDVLNKQFGKTK